MHLHSEEIGVDVPAQRHQEALQMLDAFLGRRSGRCVLSPAVDEEVRRVVERVVARMVRSSIDMPRAGGSARLPTRIENVIHKCIDRGKRLVSRMTLVGSEHAANSAHGENSFDRLCVLKVVRERDECLAGQARRGANAGKGYLDIVRQRPHAPRQRAPQPEYGGRPLQEMYIDAVRGSAMEKKQDNVLMEAWGPQAETGLTEAEVKAARERWASLSGEEQRRLMLEYGDERMRQERFAEIL